MEIYTEPKTKKERMYNEKILEIAEYVLRVLSRVLTDKTSIRDFFKGSETIEDEDDETVQLQFEFKFYWTLVNYCFKKWFV